MDLSLQGKVALVTGAARGIGRAIALELAQAGARVAVADIRLGRYEGERYYRISRRVSGDDEDVPTVAAIEGAGGQAIGIELDVSNAAQVKQAVARVGRDLGAVDVLVNNAGIVSNLGTIAEMSREAWDHELAVNLSGGFSCIQATVPSMAERGWGRIINLSSVAAEMPSPMQPAYAASKAGVIALTKTVAKAYARQGVTCNAILPGLIATPLAVSMPEAWRSLMVQQMPAGRMGTPTELAAVAAFLASPAASFVNGAAIPVDGGWLVGPPLGQ